MRCRVVVDKHGWAQSKPKAARRDGLPWTFEEDHALLTATRAIASLSYADPTIQALALKHRRSSSSLATRVYALRAGIAYTIELARRASAAVLASRPARRGRRR